MNVDSGAFDIKRQFHLVGRMKRNVEKIRIKIRETLDNILFEEDIYCWCLNSEN